MSAGTVTVTWSEVLEAVCRAAALGPLGPTTEVEIRVCRVSPHTPLPEKKNDLGVDPDSDPEQRSLFTPDLVTDQRSDQIRSDLRSSLSSKDKSNSEFFLVKGGGGGNPEMSIRHEIEVVLTFDCDGPVRTWDLTRDYVDKVQETFPALDVLAECRVAKAWIDANPGRRKTANGMRRFLFNWLMTAQDKNRRAVGARTTTPAPVATKATSRPTSTVPRYMERCPFHRQPGNADRASSEPDSRCPDCIAASWREADAAQRGQGEFADLVNGALKTAKRS